MSTENYECGAMPDGLEESNGVCYVTLIPNDQHAGEENSCRVL